MAEKEKAAATAPAAVAPAAEGAAAVPPKRSPGHRGADVKDTVAEMAAKAHEISLEAGSKMAAAMKDVVNAAAGLSGFVVESARDLVQYMVRRGQMTQEEADKLIRAAEEHQPKRKGALPPPPKPAAPLTKPKTAVPFKSTAPAAKAAPAAAAKKPAAKAAAKSPAKPAAKPAAKKAAAAKKPAKPVKKAAPKSSAKSSRRK